MARGLLISCNEQFRRRQSQANTASLKPPYHSTFVLVVIIWLPHFQASNPHSNQEQDRN